MWRFFDWTYGTPSDLIIYSGESEVATIQSAEGVRQGDPMSAAAFALSVQPMYDRAVAASKAGGAAGCEAVAVLDDLTLIGPIESVLLAYEDLKKSCDKTGLQLQSEKCQVLYTHSSTAPDEIVGRCQFAGIQLVTGGLEILGGIISFDDEERADFVEKRIKQQMKYFDYLKCKHMKAPVAMRLLQVCFWLMRV